MRLSAAGPTAEPAGGHAPEARVPMPRDDIAHRLIRAAHQALGIGSYALGAASPRALELLRQLRQQGAEPCLTFCRAAMPAGFRPAVPPGVSAAALAQRMGVPGRPDDAALLAALDQAVALLDNTRA